MPRSIELTEKRLFEKTIRIQRNPCLWWNAQCAASRPIATRIALFRRRNPAGRSMVSSRCAWRWAPPKWSARSNRNTRYSSSDLWPWLIRPESNERRSQERCERWPCNRRRGSPRASPLSLLRHEAHQMNAAWHQGNRWMRHAGRAPRQEPIGRNRSQREPHAVHLNNSTMPFDFILASQPQAAVWRHRGGIPYQSVAFLAGPHRSSPVFWSRVVGSFAGAPYGALHCGFLGG